MNKHLIDVKDDDDTLCYRYELEAAVKAAVEAEREACAKEADRWSKRDDDVGAFIGRVIRARGEA